MSIKDNCSHRGYIFGMIFYLSNALENEGNKLFKEISMKQWFLLAALFNSHANKPSLSEVAQIMGYSRQNVKKLALHLEDKGLIAFVKDEKDQRVLRVTPTDKCTAYFLGREEKEEVFIANLFKDISNEEVGQLFNVLGKIEHNMRDMRNDR